MSGKCYPICGDNLVVSPDDCDSHAKNGPSSLWSIMVIPGLLVLFLAAFLYYRKMKKTTSIIPAADIKLETLLGEGNFGQVYKGLWRGNTVVAIKVLKGENLNKQELEDFTKEAELFRQLPPHPNIVQFLGICLAVTEMEGKPSDRTSTNTASSNLGIVTEFLVGGNLADHLRSTYEVVDSTGTALPQNLEYGTILGLGKGIAAGMDHLHKNDIIHKDLAARNVLVQLIFEQKRTSAGGQAEGLVPKISDFGLAGNGKNKTKIAVRWAAPEVLLDPRKASQATDVWSFGVVMFEICAACQTIPYDDLKKNSDVREFVLKGKQLEFPRVLPMECVSLFRGCLSFNQSLRPTFSLIYQELSSFSNTILSEPEEPSFPKGDDEPERPSFTAAPLIYEDHDIYASVVK